jgi:hypothetical protein
VVKVAFIHDFAARVVAWQVVRSPCALLEPDSQYSVWNCSQELRAAL